MTAKKKKKKKKQAQKRHVRTKLLFYSFFAVFRLPSLLSLLKLPIIFWFILATQARNNFFVCFFAFESVGEMVAGKT